MLSTPAGHHVSAHMAINPLVAGSLQGWTAPFLPVGSLHPGRLRPRLQGPPRPAAAASASAIAASNFPGKRQLFLPPRAPPSRGRAPARPQTVHHCGGWP